MNMFKNFYQKYRMGILSGKIWGVMMIIGYEFTKVMI